MDENQGPGDRATDGDEYPGAPRWIKILAIVGLLMVLGTVILMHSRGGHGPQRHGTHGDPTLELPTG